MRQFVVLFIYLLFPCIVMGQQASRPSWANGFHVDRQNSYLDVFQARGTSIEEARNNAIHKIADERSRATGRRYSIKENNGELSISSQDELTVKCRIVDEYNEQLPAGVYQTYLLVQTAKNPLYGYESVTVTNKYPFSARVFVPGMAQLHKGSTAKGIAFISAEVVAIGGVVAFEGMHSSYKSKINTTHNARKRQDYIDKANRMQDLRNGFIAGAAAVYFWNIVDGIVAKGKKHVEVGHVAMRLSPYATPDAVGLAMSANF